MRLSRWDLFLIPPLCILRICDPFLNATKEYQDKSNTTDEMAYDGNGNLIKDLDRNIVTIRYNILNLPEIIQFKNGNQIRNLYDASGQKLSTRSYTVYNFTIQPIIAINTISDFHLNDAVSVNGTDYIGNVEYGYNADYCSGEMDYETSYLLNLHNSEGYVSLNNYNYYRRDHLGNNREVWQANTNTTVQRTQYYPSGLPWASNSGDFPGNQSKKYNGKEFVEMHGLDEYDSQARWYQPGIMRTTTIDPLAEKYYSISPYAWCGNNPVSAVDPDGRQSVLFELALNSNKFRRFYNYMKYTLFGIGVAGTSNTVYNHFVDGDRSKEMLNALTTGATTQNAKAATPEQRKEEKKRQGRSNHEDSKIVKKHAKSVDSNIGAPDPTGGSDPKRPLDEMKVAGVVLLGVGIAAEVHDNIKKPDLIPVPEIKPIPTKPIETPKVDPLIKE